MERREKVLVELKKQLRLAGPLVVANVVQYLMQVISVIFVGHLGQQLALSSASMATSFANVTGFSLLVLFFPLSSLSLSSLIIAIIYFIKKICCYWNEK